MPYIPHTPDDVQAMLQAIGADSIEDLFDEIPAHLKAGHGLDAQRIDLWFDRDTLLPLRAFTLESDDDTTTIDLFKAQPNTPIDPEVFDTALPTARGWETQIVPLD